jgi:hypothetical protein
MNYRLITIIYAVLLILLGLISYIVTSMQSLAALIPSAFGIVFLILGLIAMNEIYRKHIMHTASILGLIGFLLTANSLFDVAGYFTGSKLTIPAATIAKSIMSLLSLAFIIICSKSFIDARLKKIRKST